MVAPSLWIKIALLKATQGQKESHHNRGGGCVCIRNPNKRRPDTPSLQLRQHREPQAAEGFVHKKKKHFKDMGMHGSKPQKQAQVLLLGLDGSGKTTLLYKLKYNESVITVPTVGFNVETLDTDRGSPGLTVWDVGGQKRMRPHWRHHYTDTAGLVFVVDSWDQKRLGEACKELIRVIKSGLILTRATLEHQYF